MFIISLYTCTDVHIKLICTCIERDDGTGVRGQGVGSYYYGPIYMLFKRESCMFANV